MIEIIQKFYNWEINKTDERVVKTQMNTNNSNMNTTCI